MSPARLARIRAAAVAPPAPGMIGFPGPRRGYGEALRSYVDQPGSDDEDAWNDEMYDRHRSRAAGMQERAPYQHLVPKSHSHQMKDVVFEREGLPKNLAFQDLDREKLAAPKELPRQRADRESRWAAMDRQYLGGGGKKAARGPKKAAPRKARPRHPESHGAAASAISLVKKAEALEPKPRPGPSRGAFAFDG